MGMFRGNFAYLTTFKMIEEILWDLGTLRESVINENKPLVKIENSNISNIIS